MFYRKHPRVQFINPQIFDAKGKPVVDKDGNPVRMPSMTKQEFVAESDINNIVKLYKKTGQINHMRLNAAKGVYADLPEIGDFHESMLLVQKANDAFASLPAHVRDRFRNNAGAFLEFMQDPGNQEEMIAMGLAKDTRPPPAAPEQVPVSTPKPDQAEQKVGDK